MVQDYYQIVKLANPVVAAEIADNSITNVKINAAAAIAKTKLAALGIVDADVAAGAAIAKAKLAALGIVDADVTGISKSKVAAAGAWPEAEVPATYAGEITFSGGIQVGDIGFSNGWRLIEVGDGLVLVKGKRRVRLV